MAGSCVLIRDRARTLPVADSDSELEALRAWFCSYRSLTTLDRLTTPRTLIVAEYPDEDLSRQSERQDDTVADNLGTFAELEACSNAERGVVDELWIERLKGQFRGLAG